MLLLLHMHSSLNFSSSSIIFVAESHSIVGTYTCMADFSPAKKFESFFSVSSENAHFSVKKSSIIYYKFSIYYLPKCERYPSGTSSDHIILHLVNLLDHSTTVSNWKRMGLRVIPVRAKERSNLVMRNVVIPSIACFPG